MPTAESTGARAALFQSFRILKCVSNVVQLSTATFLQSFAMTGAELSPHTLTGFHAPAARVRYDGRPVSTRGLLIWLYPRTLKRDFWSLIKEFSFLLI